MCAVLAIPLAMPDIHLFFFGASHLDRWKDERLMIPVEINDEVAVMGQTERYVVMSLDGSFAQLQLFADDKCTMERRYWVQLFSAPVQSLTLIRRNHTRPAKFQLIP